MLAADQMLRQRKIAALFLVLLVLLTYETLFMPLLFVPLLAGGPWEGAWKRWSAHVLMMGAPLVAAMLVRLHLQESRITEMLSESPWGLIARMVESPFLGIAVSSKMMRMRPLDALLTIQPAEWTVTIFYFGVLFRTVVRLAVAESPPSPLCKLRAELPYHWDRQRRDGLSSPAF